ncbi:MAG: hypothetical protein WC068_00500 [Caulobacter sp.]
MADIAHEKPSSSMEEGWVVVWPLNLGEELGKAPTPIRALLAPP